MKCVVCGYEFSEGKKYCPLCGAKVQSSPAQDTAGTASAGTASVSGRSGSDDLLKSIEAKYAAQAPVPAMTFFTAPAAEKAEGKATAVAEKAVETAEAAEKAAEGTARDAQKDLEHEAEKAAKEAAEALKKAEEEAERAAKKAAEEKERLAREEQKLARRISDVDDFFSKRESERTGDTGTTRRSEGRPPINDEPINWNLDMDPRASGAKAEEPAAAQAKEAEKEAPIDWSSLEDSAPKEKDEDISWVSLDFPKPREVRDITMAWDKPFTEREKAPEPVWPESKARDVSAMPDPVWPEDSAFTPAKVSDPEIDTLFAPIHAAPAVKQEPGPFDLPDPSRSDFELPDLNRPEPGDVFAMPSWNDINYTRPSFTEEEKARIRAAQEGGPAAYDPAAERRDWEESIKKAAAEEAAARKAAEEKARKAEEEARRAEEEARRKAEEKARRKAEEEARIRAEQEAARKAEEERRAKEEAERKAAEEAAKKAALDAAALKAAEEAVKQVRMNAPKPEDGAPEDFALSEPAQDAAPMDLAEELSAKYEAPARHQGPAVGFTAGGFIDPASVEPRTIRETPFVQPLENRASAEFNWNIASEPEKTGRGLPESEEAPVLNLEKNQPVQEPAAEAPRETEGEAAEAPAEKAQTEERPAQAPEEGPAAVTGEAVPPADDDVPADDEWLNQLINEPDINNVPANEPTGSAPEEDHMSAEPAAPVLREAVSEKPEEAVQKAQEKAPEAPAEDQPPQSQPETKAKSGLAGAALFQQLLNKEVDRIRNKGDEDEAEAPEERPSVDSMTHVYQRFDLTADDLKEDETALREEAEEKKKLAEAAAAKAAEEARKAEELAAKRAEEARLAAQRAEEERAEAERARLAAEKAARQAAGRETVSSLLDNIDENDKGESLLDQDSRRTGKFEKDRPAGEAPAKAEEAPQTPTRKFTDVTSALGEEAFRRNTVEMKMAAMKLSEEAEAKHRSEYKKKLEEMSKAREAFFSEQDSTPEGRKARRAAKKAAEEKAREEAERKAREAAEEKDDLEKALEAEDGKTSSEGTRPLSEEERKQVTGRDEEDDDDEDYIDDDDDLDEDDEEGKGHPFLVFLLILALIFALAKGTVYGLKTFKPESQAATIAVQLDKAFTDAAKSGFSAVKNGVGGLINKVKGTEGEEQGEENNAPEGAQLPEDTIDMEALIEANNNGNIRKIALDPSLEYVEERTSTYTDLADSQPSDDQELRENIYAAMIAYNCAWNDYVNYGDEKVFEYLKADGDAYNRAVTYETGTEKQQEFTQLSLGQIRTFDGGVYVFTEEFITITSGDKKHDFDDRMVYRLENIGGSYKIVSYSEYK